MGSRRRFKSVIFASWYYTLGGAFAGFAAVASIVAVAVRPEWFKHAPPGGSLTVWGLLLLLAWTLIPPTFFFFDYQTIADADKRTRSKESSDLASKIWAAVLAVLVILMTTG
ncbi:MAG: hypothetical protein AAF593_00760 [Planctomycetota bacterium]